MSGDVSKPGAGRTPWARYTPGCVTLTQCPRRKSSPTLLIPACTRRRRAATRAEIGRSPPVKRTAGCSTANGWMCSADTHENAGRLLAALASTSSPDLAGVLEQAVEAAGQRAAANGLPGTILDELLGCLNPSAVTSAGLASRLEDLTATGGPPPLAPRSASDFHRTRYTLLDALAEAGMQVPTAVATTVSALDDELTVLQGSSTDQSPEPDRRLPELFLAADAAIAASGIDHQQLRMLLLRAASELARDDGALPDTPVGQRAATLLLDAADRADAG